MKLTNKDREQADYIHNITIEQAQALPNMHGVLCAAKLKIQGWYGCTLSDGKHLYILAS